MIRCVTTFAAQHWPLYAERFLDSYLEHWNWPLTVYMEGPAPDYTDPLIEWRDLMTTRGTDGTVQDFADLFADFIPQDYRTDIARFARKVFAQIDAAERAKTGRLLWLDADMVVHQYMPEHVVDDLFDGHPLAFLGRAGYYTETGFIGFDLDALPADFWSDYRAIYDSGLLLRQTETHDCIAFDIVREDLGLTEHNLCPNWGAGDLLHVFPTSPLAPYLDHLKGPTRKLAGFSKERVPA